MSVPKGEIVVSNFMEKMTNLEIFTTYLNLRIYELMSFLMVNLVSL